MAQPVQELTADRAACGAGVQCDQTKLCDIAGTTPHGSTLEG